MANGEKLFNQCCAFFPRNIYSEIDDFIMKNYDRYYKNFVEFWSTHKYFYPCKLAAQGSGDAGLCSAAIICDGHMKIRRRVCANANAPLYLPEHFVDIFQPLIVGCSHTPNINEKLCSRCKNNNITITTSTSQNGSKRKKVTNKKSQALNNIHMNDMATVSRKK